MSKFRGELAYILRKATALKRNDRYQSILELKCDLERYLAREPISGYRDSVAYRVRLFCRRTPHHAVALVLMGIVLVLGPLVVVSERARRQAVTLATETRAWLAAALDDIDPYNLKDNPPAAFLRKIGERILAAPAPDAEKWWYLAKVARLLDNSKLHTEAVTWFEHAFESFDRATSMGPGSEVDMEAKARNWYAWALKQAADVSPPDAGIFRERAVQQAHLAWQLLLMKWGPVNPHANCAMMDYGAMLMAAGHEQAEYEEFFLGSWLIAENKQNNDEQRTELKNKIREVVGSINSLWPTQPDEARSTIAAFIKPFMTETIYEGRLPWSLSQFASWLDRSEARSYLGRVVYPRRESAIALATYAYEESCRRNGPKHVDTRKCCDNLSKLTGFEGNCE